MDDIRATNGSQQAACTACLLGIDGGSDAKKDPRSLRKTLKKWASSLFSPWAASKLSTRSPKALTLTFNVLGPLAEGTFSASHVMYSADRRHEQADRRRQLGCTGTEERLFLDSRKARAALLIAGLLLEQICLHREALLGQTVLAPTDILQANHLLGSEPTFPPGAPQNAVLIDSIQVFIPWLYFAARELGAGRLPLWNPLSYCGAPFLANNQSSLFSPFSWIFFLVPNPTTLAWIALLKGVVGGIGTYILLRSLRLSTVASLFGAWSYPLCGFMTAWLLFPLSASAAWLPWTLWATRRAVLYPHVQSCGILALLTALTLLAGHLETSFYQLIASTSLGAYVWYSRRSMLSSPFLSLLSVGTALGLALIVSAVQILPTWSYLLESDRLLRRAAGESDDPRADASELIRLMLPKALGTSQAGSRSLSPLSYNEGASQGYVGCVLVCAFLPLVLTHRVRRRACVFWIALLLAAASPLFGVPLMHAWELVFPFSLLRNNRALLLVTISAIVLVAHGIDAAHNLSTRIAGQSVARGLLCVASATLLTISIAEPSPVVTIYGPSTWMRLRPYFLINGVLLLTALILMCFGGGSRGRFRVTLLCSVGILELIITASDYNPRCDRRSFFPEPAFIKFLRSHIGHGRIASFREALLPNIAMIYGLRDIRGYDAVDSHNYLSVLRSIAFSDWTNAPSYAPLLAFSCHPSPILDMMAANYIVSPNPLNHHGWSLAFENNGMFVYHNENAVDRAYVPRSVIQALNRSEELSFIAAADFNPRETAVVLTSTEESLDSLGREGGSVAITNDGANTVSLTVRLSSKSLVVLADRWSQDWCVEVDGRSVTPIRVNGIFRGVVVPDGDHDVVWHYQPRLVELGAALSIIGVCTLLCVLGYSLLRPSREKQ